MRLITYLSCLLFMGSYCENAHAQNANNPLRAFFETRLLDNPNAKPPSYEKLLTIIDSIKSADPNDVKSSLPLIKQAAESKTPNLAVEAVFALYEVSRRPDGGQLLGGSLPLLMNLMGSEDERIRNGSVVTMRTLSSRIPDSTIPPMSSVLGQSRYTQGVKSEVFRAILDSKFRSDPKISPTLETYINSSTDVNVMRETLLAIAASRYNSQESLSLALRSLESHNEPLQISAIQALFSMGGEARNKAQPVWAKLATDTTKSDMLRHFADQALRGTLSQPGKLPEGKPAPRLQGVP